jgi:hypothetical protein
MSTIIEYTDTKHPQNAFPERIVSPVRSGPCCFTDMEVLGEPQAEGRWIYTYKRCRRCGFTVRSILRVLPNAELIAKLQSTLKTTLERFD